MERVRPYLKKKEGFNATPFNDPMISTDAENLLDERGGARMNRKPWYLGKYHQKKRKPHCGGVAIDALLHQRVRELLTNALRLGGIKNWAEEEQAGEGKKAEALGGKKNMTRGGEGKTALQLKKMSNNKYGVHAPVEEKVRREE